MIDIKNYLKNSVDLSESELLAAKITSEELLDIYYDYLSSLEELKTEGLYLSNRLQFCDDINSVRWRTKDPIHLLTKIVRKRKEDISKGKTESSYLSLDVSNYKQIITDLVGLRAIYLFKFQWQLVDSYIFENFKLSSIDKINIYHAPEDDLSFYYAKGYQKKIGDVTFEYDQSERDSKYRSTHYIVKPNFPHDFRVEIQIRSILDEAWGEIDHYIRYPNHQNDEHLKRKMTILNGAINGCEELATNYINYFKSRNIEVIKDVLLEDTCIEDTVQSPEDVVQDTVQSPEDVVQDTVQSPEDVVQDTVQSPEDVVQDTVQSPEDAVQDTVQSPEDVVQDTVQSPEDAVQDTVQSPEDVVKDTVQSLEDVIQDTVQSPEDTDNILSQLALESDIYRIRRAAFPYDLENHKKSFYESYKNSEAIQRAQSEMIKQQKALHEMINQQRAQSEMIKQQRAQSEMIKQQRAQSEMIKQQKALHEMIKQQRAQSEMIKQQKSLHEYHKNSEAIQKAVSKSAQEELMKNTKQSKNEKKKDD